MPQPRHSPFALTPLLPAVVLFLLGLTLGRYLPLPIAPLLITLTLSLLLFPLTELRLHLIPAHALLALAFLSAGAATYRLNQHYLPSDHLLTHPLGTTTIRLTVTTPPKIHDHLGYSFSPYTTTFLAEATAIQTNNDAQSESWQPTTGALTVSIPNDVRLTPGQSLQLTGTLALPSPPRNPGEFDYPAYLAASRIFLSFRAADTPANRNPQILDPPSPSLATFLTNLRHSLSLHLDASVADFDDDAGPTMVALFLGQRDPAIASIQRTFAFSGGAHLLAISGTHVILVAAILYFLVRPFTRRPRTRLLLVAFLITLYILATPGGTPVLRAGVGLILLSLALFLGRRAQALNLLALTFFLLLLIRPADLVDPGTQLSFATTAGLILFALPIHQRLFGKWLDRHAQLARAKNTRTARLLHAIRRTLAALFIANAVGLLVATPLTLYHFNQANPLALLTGMLLLPIVSLAIAVSMVQLLLSLVSLTLATLFAHLSVPVIQFTILTVKCIAALPGSSFTLRAPPIPLILLAYTILLLWYFQKFSRATLTVLTAALLTTTAGWYSLSAPPPALRLYSLDVGRGSCLILQTPDGQTALLNAGSASRTALALRTIDPFLRHLGIPHPTLLLATHLDTLHASAFPDLLTLYPRTPLAFPSTIQLGNLPTQTMSAARLTRAPLHPLSPADTLHLGSTLTLTPLWPPPTLPPNTPTFQTIMQLRLTTPTHTYLLLDPTAPYPIQFLLATNQLHADAILFTSQPSPDLVAILIPLHIPLLTAPNPATPIVLPE